jgi:hypothetical protein
LVIIAALTGIAIAYQAREMTRSTKEMKASTRIAERNVEAFVRNERARLLIHKIQEPYLVTVETAVTEERLSHCVFFVKNFGKGLGTIVASRFELQMSDSVTAPPLPAIYDMKPNTVTFTPYILPQGESWPAEAPLTPAGFVSPEDLAAIENMRKYVWLCGIIRYYDVFERKNEEHETLFCYMWETRLNTPKHFWRPAGPAEYNKAT